MKVKNLKEKECFEPIEIQITIESNDELAYLTYLVGQGSRERDTDMLFDKLHTQVWANDCVDLYDQYLSAN